MIAIKFLTSRLAGPIAAGLCLVLIVLLASALIGKGRAERSRDVALAARDVALVDLGRCQANARSLEGAIGAQNAALTAKSAEDARRLAGAEKAVTAASRSRAAAEAAAARLQSRAPTGLDACARAVSAFENVKGAL